MSEAPERFREPAPVEFLSTQIPFEGRVFIGDEEVHEFDSSGRLVSVSEPDPRDPDAPWTTSRRSYDAEGRLHREGAVYREGRLISLEDGSSIERYTYDSAGRLSSAETVVNGSRTVLDKIQRFCP